MMLQQMFQCRYVITIKGVHFCNLLVLTVSTPLIFWNCVKLGYLKVALLMQKLYIQVKLAEDMVTRGSLTSSLSHLLQNHLNSTPQSFGGHNIARVSNVSPSITMHGDDASYPGLTGSGQTSTLGVEHVDAFNGNFKNGIISDAVSCASEIWPWGSHASTMSKQTHSSVV